METENQSCDLSFQNLNLGKSIQFLLTSFPYIYGGIAIIYLNKQRNKTKTKPRKVVKSNCQKIERTKNRFLSALWGFLEFSSLFSTSGILWPLIKSSPSIFHGKTEGNTAEVLILKFLASNFVPSIVKL